MPKTANEWELKRKGIAMIRARFLAFCIAILTVPIPACSGQREWEITAENKADAACSIVVTHTIGGGNGNAKVDDLGKGKTIVLVGGSGETTVQTVKVVRGNEEQTITPNQKLIAGKRFVIVVGIDGKASTSLADR
jgi:hypothetical protein